MGETSLVRRFEVYRPHLRAVARDGQPIAVLGFTVRGGRIVELFVITDRTRLRRL